MQRVHITPAQYHDLKFDSSKLPNLAAAGPISASVLSKSRDPLKFLTSVEEDFKVTSSIEWGLIVDCLWTTPEAFSTDYIVLPEDAPQRPTDAMLAAKNPNESSLARQKWWKTFDHHAAGKTIITAEQHKQAMMAIRMLDGNYLAKEIWNASDKQVALLGENPYMPGTKAKCLIDLLPLSGPFADAIVDLKSTFDTSEHGMAKTMRTFDYVPKLAFYGMMAKAAGLGERNRGVLIWQCSSFPYDVHTREIDPADMKIGRQVVFNRMRDLSQLDKLRVERHYDTQLKMISLPEWARNEILE